MITAFKHIKGFCTEKGREKSVLHVPQGWEVMTLDYRKGNYIKRQEKLSKRE